MPPYKISFGHAFERWHATAVRERKAMPVPPASPVRSWEALDHIVGLAVEAGLKAIMIHSKMVTAQGNGDYPAGVGGNRPHIRELWDRFQVGAKGRLDAHTLRQLTPKSTGHPFQSWESSHRYAEDGTVSEATLKPREEYLKAVHSVIGEIGL
jgi:hypothetical protein